MMVVNVIACLQGIVRFGQPDGICKYLKKGLSGEYKCQKGNTLVRDVSKAVTSFDPDVGGRVNCLDKQTI